MTGATDRGALMAREWLKDCRTPGLKHGSRELERMAAVSQFRRTIARKSADLALMASGDGGCDRISDLAGEINQLAKDCEECILEWETEERGESK